MTTSVPLRLRRVALGATLGFVLCGSTGFAAPPDAWITTKTKMALFSTSGVSGTRVNVDTVDGRVTLHGAVRSDAEKAKATDIARSIDGVTDVRNLLQVVPEQRKDAIAETDDAIKRNVEKSLGSDPELKDVSVQSVNKGVVLLAGEVGTLGAHLRAVEKAGRVAGVDHVESEIKSPSQLGDAEIYNKDADRSARSAAGDAARSVGTTARDTWITSDIKMRLLADGRTPGLDVNVDTRDGAVTLFGTVPSNQAKLAAAENARAVSGVKSVDNALQVVPAAKQDTVAAKDDDVENRVEAALGKQQDLKNAKIDVEVENGVARLTGTVPNEADRLRAAVVTRTTSGVKAVKDDLRVQQN